MKKIIEETWSVIHGDDLLDINRPNDGGGVIETYNWPKDHLRIAACAPEALRLLLEAESGTEDICLWCGGSSLGNLVDADHVPDCRWVLLMKKAGLR